MSRGRWATRVRVRQFAPVLPGLGATNGAAPSARAGLRAGLLILLNPALIVVMAPWLACVAWRDRATIHHLVRFGSGFVVAAVLACAPWTVRNSSSRALPGAAAPAALFVAAAWVLYPAIYYLHVSLPNFRCPTLWVSLICAGVVLASIRR